MIIVVAGLSLIAAVLAFKLVESRSENKELTDKIVSSQNELLKTKKELEDLTKEHNRKYDPYSSETTKSLILSIDINGNILSLNDYAVEFFGYASSEEMVGRNVIGFLVPPKDSRGQNMTNIIERIKSNPRLYVDHENENICKDGRRVWISWTNRIVYDKDGAPSEIRAVGFDITPRKELEEELRQMTVIDPVTGVLNRRQFLEDGAKEMKRAVRYNRDLSIVLMTIDRFDALNSEHGSTFGDEAVRVAVTACQNSTRDSDYLGRLADIEFALLLPETPLNGARIVAERIRDSVMKSNLVVNGVTIAVTTSLSIAARVPSDGNVETVLLRAFNALRSSKDRQNHIAVAETPED